MTRSKRPRDPNQLAKFIVGVATGEAEDRKPIAEGRLKDPKAVARGQKGGQKGGQARAAALTPEQRAEAARLAAHARWRRGAS